VRHDPSAFRIYAADDDILDVISGDVYTAGRAVWSNEHINDIEVRVPDEIQDNLRVGDDVACLYRRRMPVWTRPVAGRPADFGRE
jgi:hypothetical protein